MTVPFWKLCTFELSEFLVQMTSDQLLKFASEFYDLLPWDERGKASDRIYRLLVVALCTELRFARLDIERHEQYRDNPNPPACEMETAAGGDLTAVEASIMNDHSLQETN